MGYLGIEKDYKAKKILIPSKKPRKTKQGFNPGLTDQQKEKNKEIGRQRVKVEHTICGIKRFNILVNKFRNKKRGFADMAITIASGLWNLKLSL